MLSCHVHMQMLLLWHSKHVLSFKKMRWQMKYHIIHTAIIITNVIMVCMLIYIYSIRYILGNAVVGMIDSYSMTGKRQIQGKLQMINAAST